MYGVAIQPKQQLILRPDAAIPWIDPSTPHDAEPGRRTVEYSTRIYRMGDAVRAQNIVAARDIWSRLAADVSPEAAAVAAKALDAADWRVLGRLFP